MDISRHHSQGKYLESQPLQLLSSLPSESRRSSRPQQQGQNARRSDCPSPWTHKCAEAAAAQAASEAEVVVVRCRWGTPCTCTSSRSEQGRTTASTARSHCHPPGSTHRPRLQQLADERSTPISLRTCAHPPTSQKAGPGFRGASGMRSPFPPLPLIVCQES